MFNDCILSDRMEWMDKTAGLTQSDTHSLSDSPNGPRMDVQKWVAWRSQGYGFFQPLLCVVKFALLLKCALYQRYKSPFKIKLLFCVVRDKLWCLSWFFWGTCECFNFWRKTSLCYWSTAHMKKNYNKTKDFTREHNCNKSASGCLAEWQYSFIILQTSAG